MDFRELSSVRPLWYSNRENEAVGILSWLDTDCVWNSLISSLRACFPQSTWMWMLVNLKHS